MAEPTSQQIFQTTMGPTAFPTDKEVVDYTFYDSALVVSATATNYSLFATAGTDDLFSNFIGQGSMPAGQAFLASAIRVAPIPGTPAQDVLALLKAATLIFQLDNAKLYARAPLWAFPAGLGLQAENVIGNAAPTSPPANGLPWANNGFPSLGNSYRFKRPVMLRSQQPFTITLAVRSAVLAASVRIYAYLDGQLVRNII